MPEPGKVPPSSEVVSAENQVRLLRLQLEKSRYERQLALEAEEAELKLREKELWLQEQKARLAYGTQVSTQGGTGVGDSTQEAQQQLLAEIKAAQESRIELESSERNWLTRSATWRFNRCETKSLPSTRN